MRKTSYEYRGFTIHLSYGDWVVYGTNKNTMRYGYIRRFDTSKEAEDFIDREFY